MSVCVPAGSMNCALCDGNCCHGVITLTVVINASPAEVCHFILVIHLPWCWVSYSIKVKIEAICKMERILFSGHCSSCQYDSVPTPSWSITTLSPDRRWLDAFWAIWGQLEKSLSSLLRKKHPLSNGILPFSPFLGHRHMYSHRYTYRYTHNTH